MIYLLIYADSRVLQVGQLTEEILEDYAAARVEIIQAPLPSGSVLSELVEAKGDVLLWSSVKTYQGG
jgi:hypothetical protein